MSTPKRPSLADFGRRTSASPPDEPAEAQETRATTPRPRGGKERKQLSDGRIQMQTWQQPAAVKELKRLSLELDRSVSDLVAEGIDYVLQQNGRPPLARPNGFGS